MNTDHDDPTMPSRKEGEVVAPYWAPHPTCRACSRPSVPGSYLCDPCRRLMGRLETRKDPTGRGRVIDKQARLRAMQEQWDKQEQCFRCRFTDIPLTGDYGSTSFPTWEHLTPGDESSVVLVADLINRMKADMTEPEFKSIVHALAQKFKGKPFDEEAFPRRERRTT